MLKTSPTLMLTRVAVALRAVGKVVVDWRFRSKSELALDVRSPFPEWRNPKSRPAANSGNERSPRKGPPLHCLARHCDRSGVSWQYKRRKDMPLSNKWTCRNVLRCTKDRYQAQDRVELPLLPMSSWSCTQAGDTPGPAAGMMSTCDYGVVAGRIRRNGDSCTNCAKCESTSGC